MHSRVSYTRLQHTAMCCKHMLESHIRDSNTLLNTVERILESHTRNCNTMQRAATHMLEFHISESNTLQRAATHCNALQHTATRCNTHTRVPYTSRLQNEYHDSCVRRAHRLNSMPRVVDTEHLFSHKRQQHTATRCNTLQRAATHCNALQHTC